MIDKITNKVCVFFGVDYGDLISRTKTDDLVYARNVIYYTAVKHYRQLGYSYQKVGRMFNRDHSTVIHGVKKFEHELKIYPLTKQTYEDFIKFLNQ